MLLRMIKTTVCLLIALALFSSFSAYADDSCNNLNIQIANATTSVCQLVASGVKIVHGRYAEASQPPSLIAPGMNENFVVSTYVSPGHGPDIILEYQCGEGAHITFESKQTYCFTAAGAISGALVSAAHLKATSNAVKGSWFAQQHGSIAWIINEDHS